MGGVIWNYDNRYHCVMWLILPDTLIPSLIRIKSPQMPYMGFEGIVLFGGGGFIRNNTYLTLESAYGDNDNV